jgi:hypothetical protein
MRLRGLPGLAEQPRDQDSPRRTPDMRKPADQSRITDVSRLRPHRCTIIASINLRKSSGGWRVARPGLDLGHQSILRDFLIPPFGLLLMWLRRGKDASRRASGSKRSEVCSGKISRPHTDAADWSVYAE